MATNAELAPLLGVTRAESVPNLTRRFGILLATDATGRKQLATPSNGCWMRPAA